MYGDYPKLASRCLSPVSQLYKSGVEVRIGLNETSEATNKVVSDLFIHSDRLVNLSFNPQIFKYPMMDRLFKAKPITTDYVMWFDDDSFIKDSNPLAWLSATEKFMNDSESDMAGAIYHIPILPGQTDWRRLHCDWFVSGPLPGRPEMTKFATGGWWIIKTSVINKYKWPHPMLKHCGGDVLLGELIRHQGLKLSSYKAGVAVNADDNGKESASDRRGYNEPPLGSKKTQLEVWNDRFKKEG